MKATRRIRADRRPASAHGCSGGHAASGVPRHTARRLAGRIAVQCRRPACVRYLLAPLATSLVAIPAFALPQQDALRPAGIQALHIVRLWNLTLVVTGIVFAAVLAVLLVALVRRPRAHETTPPDLRGVHHPERRTRRFVVGASGASVVLLAGLIVADVFTDGALSRLPIADPLHIELTGQQWWWQAVYPPDHGRPGFTVANELHVPVGRPVVVSLKASDVIHSFWVPNLHGKKDMLPGIDSRIEFRADETGTWRGQCAQFCGPEHALMAMLVTADTPSNYAAWAAHQATPAATPQVSDVDAARGMQVFLQAGCANCHAVQGSPAAGATAPDLTHLMSRTTLAAGVLANTPANLAAWIRHPDSFKPATTMPTLPLSDADLHAVVSWLATLQ
ncbi:cytochrome c oxidase subunit II [Paraburkholderia kururiensis]|uniref:cytochrome c oxidase subunit II n=1 Tax=Paraburkholderia kururiensis TaxID=984307 RepID=UPI0039A721D2